MRSIVVTLLLVSLAHAGPKNGEQARAANQTAFQRALVPLKVKPIQLAATVVDPSKPLEPGGVVVAASSHQSAGDVFVVDARQNVFRVVRVGGTLGKFSVSVCHAGPVRAYSLRYGIPPGHTYKGELKVAYDTYDLAEENSCR